MTGDELSGGREPRPRLRAAALVGALAVAAAFAGERVVDHQERGALRRCVAASEADVADVTRRAAGVEQYVSPALNRPDVAPAVRDSLRSIVQLTVLRGLPSLRRDRDRCGAVGGWHPRVREGRRAYLGYLDLEVRQLTLAAHDLDALHGNAAAIGSARAQARHRLAAVKLTLSP